MTSKCTHCRVFVMIWCVYNHRFWCGLFAATNKSKWKKKCKELENESWTYVGVEINTILYLLSTNTLLCKHKVATITNQICSGFFAGVSIIAYWPFNLWSRYSRITLMTWTIDRIKEPNAKEPVWYLKKEEETETNCQNKAIFFPSCSLA